MQFPLYTSFCLGLWNADFDSSKFRHHILHSCDQLWPHLLPLLWSIRKLCLYRLHIVFFFKWPDDFWHLEYIWTMNWWRCPRNYGMWCITISSSAVWQMWCTIVRSTQLCLHRLRTDTINSWLIASPFPSFFPQLYPITFSQPTKIQYKSTVLYVHTNKTRR